MPVEVVGITDAKRISTGGQHACAVVASGAVWCWGLNGSGQLGAFVAAPGIPSSSKPVRVKNLEDAIDVAAGDNHTCARRRGGTISCWGGELQGGANEKNAAAPVRGVSGVKAVATGIQGDIAIERENGTVARFFTEAKIFELPALSHADAITMGGHAVCARMADKVTCQGGWFSGPTEVAALAGSRELSGSAEAFCGLTSAGALRCVDEHGPLERSLPDAGPAFEGRLVSVAAKTAVVVAKDDRIDCGGGLGIERAVEAF